MKVVYKINKPIFNALEKIFKETKEVEDNWDLANLIESENETVYMTCCGNKWFIGFNENYYFGYEGTRNGFRVARPFYDSSLHLPRFYLDYPSDPYCDYPEKKELIICIREDYLDDTDEYKYSDDVKHFTDEYKYSIDYENNTVSSIKYVCFKLSRIIEYKTTLPAEIVHPLDTVETLLADESKAIVMRGNFPLIVIEYKNMYK
ncbi:MAG: hypothetical protein QXS37_06115 [Candidatus Aenigmatarchaeota archaeon]